MTRGAAMMPAVLSAETPIEIRRRAIADRRPASDPGCAGCALMGVFRALRRAGLEVRGGPGCDAGAPRMFQAAPGRWAAVVGVGDLLRGDPTAAAERARASGALLLVVADRRRAGATARAVSNALARAGARALAVDGRHLARAEEAVARAEALARDPAGAPVAIVSLVRCGREAPRAPALAVEPARCNRCGACIGLGCPALSDAGGEAMEIDRATCVGCGACVPLCRSRAIG